MTLFWPVDKQNLGFIRKMENKLVSKSEFSTLPSLPEGFGLVAIKFVSVGPNTQADFEHSVTKICEFAEQQPMFFIISQSSESFREILHEYVDRFCDARENKS